MPIQLFWDEDHPTILHSRFEKPWSWRDLHEVTERERALSEATDIPGYVLLVDFTESPCPPNGSAITSIMRAVRNQPQKRQLLIIITHESFFHALTPIIHQQIPGTRRQIVVVDTLEDAYANALAVASV